MPIDAVVINPRTTSPVMGGSPRGLDYSAHRKSLSRGSLLGAISPVPAHKRASSTRMLLRHGPESPVSEGHHTPNPLLSSSPKSRSSSVPALTVTPAQLGIDEANGTSTGPSPKSRASKRNTLNMGLFRRSEVTRDSSPSKYRPSDRSSGRLSGPLRALGMEDVEAGDGEGIKAMSSDLDQLGHELDEFNDDLTRLDNQVNGDQDASASHKSSKLERMQIMADYNATMKAQANHLSTKSLTSPTTDDVVSHSDDMVL